ncbi:unnamed protein product [Polarella glacialis]|uniref:Uncharacterized protein n=1 Tax=Polarella glacialis TaxID=89957 RepID=A0A813GSR0_POLGL|nr:unnamed protein product [Polarella glacialis]
MQLNVAIPHEQQQHRRWNFDNIRDPQKCRTFAEDLRSAQQDLQYRTDLQHSFEHGTPDTSWDILNAAVLQAEVFFSTTPPTRIPGSPMRHELFNRLQSESIRIFIKLTTHTTTTTFHMNRGSSKFCDRQS